MMMNNGGEATVDEDDMKIQILSLTKLWRTLVTRLVGPSWQDMLPDPRGLVDIEKLMRTEWTSDSDNICVKVTLS